MRSLPWDRGAVIEAVRHDIHRHVPADTVGGHRIASTLLGLDHADVRRLASLHWLLSPQVEGLLAAAGPLLRRMPSTTDRPVETRRDRPAGPVDPAATSIARSAHHPDPVLATRPTVRDLDVPENQALRYALDAVVAAARHARLADSRSGSGRRAYERSRAAAGHLRFRALRDVTSRPPGPRALSRMRDGRRRRALEPLLAALRHHDDLVVRADPAALRRAVDETGLATARDGTLFEVSVLFGITRCLVTAGWDVDDLGLFGGGVTFGSTRGGDTLDVHYQRLPAGLRGGDVYADTLEAHGIRRSELRPDLVLAVRRVNHPPLWLLVEAKTTTGSKTVTTLARRALQDLLAYRHAFGPAVAGQSAWGLGVVWGEDLGPAPGGQVALVTPDRLDAALAPHLA